MSKWWFHKQRPDPWTTHEDPSNRNRGDAPNPVYFDSDDELDEHIDKTVDKTVDDYERTRPHQTTWSVSMPGSSRDHPYRRPEPKTPIKQGPSGPTPHSTPIKDNGTGTSESVPMDVEGREGGGGGDGANSELNPNNSAKVTSVLRPLSTPSWVVTMDHRYTYDFRNLQELPWITEPNGLKTKITDFHTIQDRHIGAYTNETEITMLRNMGSTATHFSIKEAGWRVVGLQLYCLNLIDPGMPKYQNTNNQDPYLYTLTDIHDLPMHYFACNQNDTVRTGMSTTRATAFINIDRTAQYKTTPALKMGFTMRAGQAPCNADSWIPFERLTQFDKTILAQYKRKLDTWCYPIAPPVDASPYFDTNTLAYGGTNATCNTGLNGAQGYFPTKADVTIPVFGSTATALQTFWRSFPVGPNVFSDTNLVNPYTSMPAFCGEGNMPFLLKIQDIQNPDGSYVDIHIELVVEKKLVIEFGNRGYQTCVENINKTSKVFNYPAHNVQAGGTYAGSPALLADYLNRNYESGIDIDTTVATNPTAEAKFDFLGHTRRQLISTTNCPIPPPPADLS